MIIKNRCSDIVKVLSLGLTISLTALSLSVIAADSHQWTYKKGDSGPENWSELSTDYHACNNGKNQSPVNIDKTVDGKLPSIPYNYSILIPETIKNNGHTIQVVVRSGGQIEVDGKEYKLKQFHFHAPSENTIKGKSFPMEVHFVHLSDDGNLAVIAIMYTLGAPDPLLANIWRQMPYQKGQSNPLNAKALTVLETDKKLKAYIRFNGSITIPPCTEGVTWIVKKAYNSISMPQLKMMHKALKQPNNRPVQNTNARVIVD